MTAWENFNKLAETVTNEIIEGIQNENLTWEQVWNPKNAAKNYASNRPYLGFNALWLAWVTISKKFNHPYFLTFKQAKQLGGNVKKDQKGTKVVFWKDLNLSKGKAETKLAMTRMSMVGSAHPLSGQFSISIKSRELILLLLKQWKGFSLQLTHVSGSFQDLAIAQLSFTRAMMPFTALHWITSICRKRNLSKETSNTIPSFFMRQSIRLATSADWGVLPKDRLW